MTDKSSFGANECAMPIAERRAKLATAVHGGLDIDNSRFLTLFADTMDDNRERSPVGIWAKERAVLGPMEWVPTRYLVPDWIDFWQSYKDGKYDPAAQTTVFRVGSLQRTIRKLYRPDESGFALGSYLASLLDPIRPSPQVDHETGERAAGLSGIRLLTHGRTLGEKVDWKALGVAPCYGQAQTELNYALPAEVIKAERKAAYVARRRENKLFREAVQRGLPARLAQEALRTVPMDLAFVPALEYMMRFSDDIFG